MKKLIIALVIALAMVGIASADGHYNGTFQWEQNTSDLPNLEKWLVKMRSEPGGTVEHIMEIPYTGGSGPDFKSDQSMLITGKPGELVTKYFSCSAVGKNGRESAETIEISHDFVMPYYDVTTPIRFSVTIVAVPK